MPAVRLGVALVVGAVLLARGFLSLEPHELARILRWTGAVLAVLLTLLLILSGREGLLLTGAALAVPLLLRGRWRRGLGSDAGPAPGRTSSIETRMLRMILEHDSGRLTGEVLAGRLQGRRLDQLSFAEAVALLDECRSADPEALPVLETWLDRAWGADWRLRAQGFADSEAGGSGAGSSGAPPAPGGAMTRDEALSILGLAAGAGPEAVREAHRRLMARVHPDHGGSTWLAAKLNQARDLLSKSSGE